MLVPVLVLVPVPVLVRVLVLVRVRPQLPKTSSVRRDPQTQLMRVWMSREQGLLGLQGWMRQRLVIEVVTCHPNEREHSSLFAAVAAVKMMSLAVLVVVAVVVAAVAVAVVVVVMVVVVVVVVK